MAERIVDSPDDRMQQDLDRDPELKRAVETMDWESNPVRPDWLEPRSNSQGPIPNEAQTVHPYEPVDMDHMGG